MYALKAKTTQYLAYKSAQQNNKGNIIQYSLINQQDISDNERVAKLLVYAQDQVAAQQEVPGDYRAHDEFFNQTLHLSKVSLLARLRRTLDYVQCSKFSTLHYQCFDLNVNLNGEYNNVPLFYIKKRKEPIPFTEQKLVDFITIVKKKGFKQQQARQALTEQGFFLSDHPAVSNKIIDNLIEYLKTVDIKNLTPDSLKKYNADLVKIAEKPVAGQLLDFKAKSLLQRKLSYAATVVYFLKYKGFPVEGLTEAQALQIEKLLEARINEEIANTFTTIEEQNINVNNRVELTHFLKTLTEEIHKITGGEGAKIQEAILHAERYHTATLNARRCLVSEAMIYDMTGQLKQDFYVEFSLNNRLTGALKSEYLKIYTSPPAWYKNLPLYAQDWLTQVVPKQLNGDWSYFESLRFPSTIQNLPGMKNVRDCYSVLGIDSDANDDAIADTYKIYSKNTKGATLATTSLTKVTDKHRIANLNVEQLLEHFLCKGKKEFNAFWGLEDDLIFYTAKGEKEVVKPVVFIHSLLTRIKGLRNARGVDNHMIATQNQAVDEITAKFSHTFDIVRGNDPANGFQGLLTNHSDYWEHTRQLFCKAERLFYALGLGRNKQWNQQWWDRVISALDNGNPDLLLNEQNRLAHLNDEQKEHITKAIFAIKNLRALKMINVITENDKRNYRAYKSLYQAVLAESLQWLVFSNCQSGKDRTNKDAKFRKAANIHFMQLGSLPFYNDEGPSRENFIDIFDDLTHSKMFDVSAGRNSPGADGIKERQEQKNIYTAIKVGKIVIFALSALGLAAGIGLCFVAPLLGAGLICGSIGVAGFNARSFSRTPFTKLSGLAILTSIIVPAVILATGVGITAAAVATGGISLIVGASFLALVAGAGLFAGVVSAYGKWAKLRRGVTDDDITARSKEEYSISLELADLNKPKLLTPNTKAKVTEIRPFEITSRTASLQEIYRNWKLCCSAYLTRNKQLKERWATIEQLINKKDKNKDDVAMAIENFRELIAYADTHGSINDNNHLKKFADRLSVEESKYTKAPEQQIAVSTKVKTALEFFNSTALKKQPLAEQQPQLIKSRKPQMRQ